MELDPETTLSHAGRSLGECLNHTVPSRAPSPDDGPDNDPSSSRRALEDTLSCLDDGADAVACTSGRAAVQTAAEFLPNDAHVLCAQDCGPKTSSTLSGLADDGRLAVSYEDVSDREALTDAVRPNTEALWIESPSHAHLRVYDLETLAAFAEANDLLLIVDNTALSPFLQRPIEHGADLVIYTSTHPLTGQSDVDGGAVVARTDAQSAALRTTAQTQNTTASAFDCWLTLRDIKTLPARIQQHETNARSLAYDLNEHPAVEQVFYPGLRNHPDHATAREQQDGYGYLVSIVVDPEQVDVPRFLAATELFTVQDGPGGVSSRVHRSEDHDALLRLSIGTESTTDLENDLTQAFAAARIDDTDSTEPVREPVPVTNRASESRRSSAPVR
jgi:cystathionine gamma-synthase